MKTESSGYFINILIEKHTQVISLLIAPLKPPYAGVSMSTFRPLKGLSAFILLIPSLCLAHENAMVNHHDLIQIDPALTLTQVIRSTVKKSPDVLLTSATEQEAIALQQRGTSWLAGAPSIALRYQDDLPGDDIGSREIETELELPLWNWGQRTAAQQLAEQANINAQLQASVINLKIAGYVRHALWNIELEQLRYEHAKSSMEISAKLLEKIQRRVELGDLPRSDYLLAKSDHLQKLSFLTQAEAEMMHSRQNYISLTQSDIIPANFKETQSPLTVVPESHPQLLAINALIERKKAEMNWVKSAGSGQPSFIFGGKSEKGSENDDDIESLSVEISIPFGGSAHLAPEIAAANIELTQVLSERAYLLRQLERQFHEAKHVLEVTLTELKIANELKQIAQAHLKMTHLSFSAGEINLMDLLKIQARSNYAIRQAKEREVLLQKYIALYNQAVGVSP